MVRVLRLQLKTKPKETFSFATISFDEKKAILFSAFKRNSIVFFLAKKSTDDIVPNFMTKKKKMAKRVQMYQIV